MTTVTTPIAFIKAEFNGRDGAGTISVPGLKAGDVVLLSTINAVASSFPRAFEAIISTDDEIYQWETSNMENEPCVLFIMRGF